METEIECEEVTVQVPKAILKLLKDSEHVIEMTVKDYIVHAVVSVVKSDLDACQFTPSEKNLVDQYDLNPIFMKVLHDPFK